MAFSEARRVRQYRVRSASRWRTRDQGHGTSRMRRCRPQKDACHRRASVRAGLAQVQAALGRLSRLSIPSGGVGSGRTGLAVSRLRSLRAPSVAPVTKPAAASTAIARRACMTLGYMHRTFPCTGDRSSSRGSYAELGSPTAREERSSLGGGSFLVARGPLSLDLQSFGTRYCNPPVRTAAL